MIDCRSDLLSRPSQAMIRAMHDAAQMVPSFGLREDPIVRRLEQLGAEMLGKEDALFCPTCTMCNQIAINLLCRPGETLVCEADSHIVTSEGGAPAALSGAMVRTVPAADGWPDPAAVGRALAGSDGAARSRVSLVVLENTHGRSGGRPIPADTTAAIGRAAVEHGASLHVDGARLFNAAHALGVAADALVRAADTVAISLNKGLGAPLGALLAGTAELMSEAELVRQRLGGGWRPATIPAAGGIIALQEAPGRLGEDHARAKRLVEIVGELSHVHVANRPVETNLVLLQPDAPGLTLEAMRRHLESRGVLALILGDALRLVFHNGIADEEVLRIGDALRELGQARAVRGAA